MEPREGRWLAKPPRRRLRLFDVAWIWSAAMIVGAFLDHLGLLSNTVAKFLALAWTLTLLLGTFFLPFRELVLRRRSRRDRRLSDGAAGVREWAVEIVVEARGKSVGADRGVVWFDGGLMGFTGERTSFLLGYYDFVWPGRNAISWIDVPFSPLKLDAPQPSAMVSVRPMWGYARGYRRGLRQFLRAKSRSEAARQWPPLQAWTSQNASTLPSPKGEGLRANGLEDAVAFENEVNQAALRVGELDQR